MKTLTHPLGQNQLLKAVDGGRNEDPHMPLLAESTTKCRWGEKCEDPHMPLWAESTTKRWGRNVKTLTQLLKVDGGRNVKTLTCPLGWNQLLKVDGGEM